MDFCQVMELICEGHIVLFVCAYVMRLGIVKPPKLDFLIDWAQMHVPKGALDCRAWSAYAEIIGPHNMQSC